MRLSARQLSVGALFLAPGLSIASWVTRTPAIRDAVDASTAQMGLVLLGLSVGSMVGILTAGAVLTLLGTRPLIVIGAVGLLASLPVVALGSVLGSAAVVTAGLALFGLGMGGAEVALNVEGGEIEQETGRSFLPLLHGCFSLGTAVGAAIGIAFTALDVPVAWHLGSVTVVTTVIVLLAVRHIPAGVGKRLATAVADGVAAPRVRVWREPALLLIGVIILGMGLAEGTANDWLPLVMVDGHGFAETLSSTVYAVFAVSMTVGRFVGGRFVDRYGRTRVLAVSAFLGALGIGLVAFVDHQAVAAAAVVLWGLGASLGFPVALSAAGDSGPDSAARVSVAATVGYVAFLVGPPALGFAGEELGLRTALVIPLAVAVAAGLVALRVGRHVPVPALAPEPVPDPAPESVPSRG